MGAFLFVDLGLGGSASVDDPVAFRRCGHRGRFAGNRRATSCALSSALVPALRFFCCPGVTDFLGCRVAARRALRFRSFRCRSVGSLGSRATVRSSGARRGAGLPAPALRAVARRCRPGALVGSSTAISAWRCDRGFVQVAGRARRRWWSSCVHPSWSISSRALEVIDGVVAVRLGFVRRIRVRRVDPVGHFVCDSCAVGAACRRKRAVFCFACAAVACSRRVVAWLIRSVEVSLRLVFLLVELVLAVVASGCFRWWDAGCWFSLQFRR